MAKQSFLLVSLQEDKAKKLAQVVSNESCRKILDYLTDKEATETELAEKLQLPLSTVHYNLKQLVDAGLVSADEFHYSKKGKEVIHYKLANKYIIIAPKSTFGIKEKLKSILPAALIVAGVGFIWQLIASSIISTQSGVEKAATVREAAIESMPQTLAAPPPQPAMLPATYLWFIAGIVMTIVIFLLFEYLKYKKSQNKEV